MPRILVGPASTAVANNTTLSAGDIAVTNEGGLKVGPGQFNSLPYMGSSVSSEPVREAASSALNFSRKDPGTVWPLAEGGVVEINVATTWNVRSDQIDDGVLAFVLRVNAPLTLPSLSPNGEPVAYNLLPEVGKVYAATAGVLSGYLAFAFYPLSPAQAGDTVAPQFGFPSLEDIARGYIAIDITEDGTPTLNGSLSGVTLTTTSGKTATGVSVVSGQLRIALSAPATDTDTYTLALAAGMVKDQAGNLSAALTTVAVANNIVPYAPPSVINDDFNRADAAGPGGDWVAVGGSIPLVGNKLQATAPGMVLRQFDFVGDEYNIEVKFTPRGDVNSLVFGIFYDSPDTVGTNGIQAQYNGGSLRTFLLVSNQSETYRQEQGSDAVTLQDGVQATLRLQRGIPSLGYYLNGDQKGGRGALYEHGGHGIKYAGIYLTSGACDFDDFSLVAL